MERCMNMMKNKKVLKILALGLCAAAAFGLAGCGGSSPAKSSASQQVQKESPLMQKIKKSGKLVVGTASGYPPYEFVDTSSGEKKVIGIDMELAQRIIDFTSGACYSLGGSLQKVSSYIFILGPYNVDITGDLQNILGSNPVPSVRAGY